MVSSPSRAIFTALLIITLLATIATATTATTASAPEHTNDVIKSVTNPCSSEINGKCIQWAISKTLGFLVVSLAFILKVPQIKNMIAAGNAEGLNLPSQYLDLFSYAAAASYNLLIQAPLTTYAETVVIAVQVFAIIVLSWGYKKTSMTERIAILVACVAYAGVVFVLPPQFWPVLMMISSGSAVFSRLTQIMSNFSQGHTGVLALMTVVLQVGGNVARIFTTMTEVDDFAVLASYLLSFVLNAAIMIQIVVYWKATAKFQAETKKAD